MFRNYFKTAWRNLNKHKLFSFINIFGLASGMTVCMLALLQIKGAYDYDSFHPDSNKSYRIITNLHRKNGEDFLCASSPFPLSSYLKKNYDAIDKSTSVYFSTKEIEAYNKKLTVKEAYVDPDFYTIFGFKTATGTVAVKPQTAVITSEAAARFFGNDNPVGQLAKDEAGNDFMITGVLATPPHPSHLTFDMLVSSSTMPLLKNKINISWDDESAAYTYVHLKPNVSQAALQSLLKNASGQVGKQLSSSANKTFAFDAQPLNKISPGTLKLYNATNEPSVSNLIVISLIGLAILLLASFNYINLTLARSLERAREVGVRKVVGARKQQLIKQFLCDSLLHAVLAFCLAYILLRLISNMPTIQRLTGYVSQDLTLCIYFVLFALATGLLAGLLPAYIFSSFQPADVLKNKFNVKLFGSIGLRKTLTVIQFGVSLIAIITLSVFYKQSLFMATADYGFMQEGIVTMQLPQYSYERAASAFSSVAGVESVSAASGLFGFSEDDTKYIRQEKTGDSIAAGYFSVSPSLLPDMGLQLIAGNNLPAYLNNKSRFAIVNEEACRALSFTNPSSAIGKKIKLNDSTGYIISGVVKNFHYTNFKYSIQPLLIVNQPDEFKVLNLKVSESNEKNIITHLKQTWEKLYPHQTFHVDLLHTLLYNQQLHEDDLAFVGLLTGMAVSIACLGLLGMIIFTTNNRSKEVGIRKIMGASVWQIALNILKEFAGLLVIAVGIGLPLGILIGDQFLQQYAYRISINFEMLAGAVMVLFLLISITAGWQIYKTAIANPVKSLRTE